MMSNENFTSALKMKDHNVRNAHVEMALQQLDILKMYSEFINKMGWVLTPKVTTETQVKSIYLLAKVLIY